ncbi:hypothetical protein MBANPS3_008378 [Mucor bainieri]
MTDRSKIIPLEIWIHALEYLQNLSDLCQCRLVCKSWDYIAESALLSKELHVDGIQKVSQIGDEPEVELLLRAAFTTTTKFLTVEEKEEEATMDKTLYKSPEFFATLVDMVKNAPPHSCFNLQRMPYCIGYDSVINQNYAKSAYAFRSTLQNLKASFDSSYMKSIFNELEVFQQLQCLELNGDTFATLADLESVLRHCNTLKKLSLYIRNMDIPHQTAAAIKTWTKAHVQQVGSLTDLETDAYNPGVIQYLIHKYPNATLFSCPDEYYQEGTFARLLDVAKNARKFSTQLYFTNLNDIGGFIHDLSRSNDDVDDDGDDKQVSVLVGIVAFAVMKSADNEAEIELDIRNDPMYPKRRLFNVVIAYASMPSSECLALLDRMSGWKLDVLALDAMNYKLIVPQAKKEYMAVNAVDMMANLAAASNMYLTIDKIQFAPCTSNDHPRWNVQRLEINTAKIDYRVPEQISQCSPFLKVIVFADCAMVDALEAPQQVFDIHMPYSVLRTVMIHTDKYPDNGSLSHIDPVCHAALIDRVLATKRCYVHIDLTIPGIQVYLLVCGSKRTTTTVHSREEFESFQDKDKAANIKITVADMKELIICLGPVRTMVNVGKLVAPQLLLLEGEKYRADIANGTFMGDDAEAERIKYEDYRARVVSAMEEYMGFTDCIGNSPEEYVGLVSRFTTSQQ